MSTLPASKNKKNSALDLKTPIHRSHNRDSDDERIKALVRLLARRAAADDYRMYENTLATPDIEDNGD
jgi:hypothetical protein